MKKIIIANLKMNLETVAQRDAYCSQTHDIFQEVLKNKNQVVFCPPITHLDHFVHTIGKLPVEFGAQDCFWELYGSFTGFNSPKTVASLGAKYVILGHSERREFAGENNAMVTKKVMTSLRVGLTPVVCVGYFKSDEDEMENIRQQINSLAESLSVEDFQKIIFAYEPVWAIGSGKTPKVEEIHTVVLFIKTVIAKNFGTELANQIRIIYGGSVTAENVNEICEKAFVQGVLVGGASLNPEVFANLVKMLG